MVLDLVPNRNYLDPVTPGEGKPVRKKRKLPAPFTVPSWMSRCELLNADHDSGKVALLSLLKSPKQVITIDTETTSTDSHTARLLVVSIAVSSTKAILLRFRQPMKDGSWLAVPKWSARAAFLKSIFLHHTIVMHNRLYDERILDRELNQPICRPFQFRADRDTMLAAYLEDGSQKTGLKALGQSHFGLDVIEFESVNFSDPHELLVYACQDVLLTWRLDAHFLKAPQGSNVHKMPLHKVEHEVSEVLREMEDWGMLVDMDTLKKQQEIMGKEVVDAKALVFKLAGSEFNLDSTAKVAKVIYDDLGIPPTQLTPGGKPSTRAEVLETMSAAHPFIPAILDYRHLSKLKSQYLDTLSDYIRSDGKIHTGYMQTITPTGRLAAHNPNLLQIPKRTRICYRASPGFTFVQADYMAVEFRLMVSLANCEPALRAIRAGRDTHRICASVLYGVPENEVTEDQRDASKTITFGLLYGMEYWGLASRLKISNGSAKELIEKYFRLWKGIKEWILKQHNIALRRGGSRTAFGRHRTLPDLGSFDPRIRGRAMRNVINDAIQGGAADIIKMRMLPTAKAVGALGGRTLLMVHDSLLFEIPTPKVKEAAKIITDTMRWDHRNFAPMEVEIEAGETWGTLKPLEPKTPKPTTQEEIEAIPLVITPNLIAEKLRITMSKCNACSARKEATQVVPFSGPVNSLVVFVGRNPGNDENREGFPFIGPGGKLLDKWISILGLIRKDVFITNIVKCHTFDDREPTPQELATCRDRWLIRELKLVKPKYIFLFGNQCIKGFLGDNQNSITKTCGQVIKKEMFGSLTYIIPFYHPGYILRKPDMYLEVASILTKLKETVLSSV